MSIQNLPPLTIRHPIDLGQAAGKLFPTPHGGTVIFVLASLFSRSHEVSWEDVR